MSGPEKPGAAAPAKDPYIDLAERIYIGLSSRVYSVGGEQKKPDPKALAAFSFRLADAFEDAFRETPREKARIEAMNKASVKIDQVDISAMFGATTPPQK